MALHLLGAFCGIWERNDQQVGDFLFFFFSEASVLQMKVFLCSIGTSRTHLMVTLLVVSLFLVIMVIGFLYWRKIRLERYKFHRYFSRFFNLITTEPSTVQQCHQPTRLLFLSPRLCRLDLPPPFKPPPVPVKYTSARWSETSLQTFPTSRCNSIAESSYKRQSYI